MINESQKNLHIEKNHDEGLIIDLAIKNVGEERLSRHSTSSSTESNKQNYHLFEEVSKLIELYSLSNARNGLTKEEFKQLARQLYASVDRTRQLEEAQLQNLVNLFDSNKDAFISREEIMAVVSESKSHKGKKV